jgi:O-antigen/teichoic acid export membrane protein
MSQSEKTEKHLTIIAKQSSVVFISKILGYFLGFLLNLIIAKYFNVKIMGQYSLLETTIQIVVVFSVFGLNNGLTKYISRYNSVDDTKKVQQIIRIVFVYAAIFSLVGTIGVILLRKILATKVFASQELIIVFFYGSGLILPITFRRIYSGLYRGFKQIKHYIFATEVIRRIIFIVFLLTAIIFDLGNIIYIIVAWILSEVIVNLYLTKKSTDLGINWWSVLAVEPDKEKQLRTEIFHFSSTVIFISFVNFILGKIDRIMLGIYQSAESVGIYRIATLVVVLLGFFHDSSKGIFSSMISELYSSNQMDVLEELYSTITKWIIILSLPLTINIIIFSEVIMNFFGLEYVSGSLALIILALGHTVRISVGANGYILKMSGWEKIVLANNGLLALINIILNMILIPKLGMTGAAISTSLAIAVVNVMKIVEVSYFLDLIPYNKQYLHLAINLFCIVIISFSLSRWWSNLGVLILSTSITFVISIAISSLFINKLEKSLLNKLKNKLANIF